MTRVAVILVTLFGCVDSLRADKIVLVAGDEKTKLISPFGVDFDKEGNLYFVEMTVHRFGRIPPKK